MPDILIEVSGRVQGVGFRWFVRERARALRLTGSVRNLHSGSVQVVARGPEDAIAELLAAVRRGPPGAIVREVVRREPIPATDYPNPFSVLP